MERVVLIAALKPGAREQALDLSQRSADASEQEGSRSARGSFSPPATPSSSRVERRVRQSISSFNDPVRSTAPSPWLALFEGPLHLAREAYFLKRGGG